MKKTLIFSILLMLYSYLSFGQQLHNKEGVYPKMVNVKSKQPLIILGSLETNYHSLVIDPDNLIIKKTYKDSLELLPFGEKGKDGVILAELKNKTPLLRLEEVLDYYKVSAKDRQLKVLVDNALVNPNLFLADVKRIKEIERIKQDVTSVMRYSFNEHEEYLNIVTVKE